MRLSVGAGTPPREGWVRLDLDPACADVVADVRALPFRPRSVEHIEALDVLEHVPWPDPLDVLLEFRRVIRPSGRLTLRVPAIDVLAARLDAPGHLGVMRNIYGGHRFGPQGAWDTHHWGWTRKSLGRDLLTTGWVVLEADHQPNITVTARPREAGPDQTALAVIRAEHHAFMTRGAR